MVVEPSGRETAEPEPVAPLDPALERRLDDELDRFEGGGRHAVDRATDRAPRGLHLLPGTVRAPTRARYLSAVSAVEAERLGEQGLRRGW